MLIQVLTWEGRSRGVVLVVGGLHPRQSGEVTLSNRAERDVIAAKSKGEQGPLRDWKVEVVSHRSSVTRVWDAVAEPGVPAAREATGP